MKCLVFSDSHGSVYYMKQALAMHPDAEVVFFLGDGLEEADILAAGDSQRCWIAVRGNCDFYSVFRGVTAKKTERITLMGYTVSATHGDLYGVKYGTEGITCLARESGSDIILFGHTHKPFEKYVSDGDKPFYLFNPGSISLRDGSYGIMMLGEVPFFSHGQII